MSVKNGVEMRLPIDDLQSSQESMAETLLKVVMQQREIFQILKEFETRFNDIENQLIRFEEVL